jgi:hypothetical protein
MKQVASLSRVASDWDYPTADVGLPAVAARLRRSLRNALQHIACDAPREVLPEPTGQAIARDITLHVGPLWRGHALSFEPCRLGFAPTEPQLIRGLASYLSEDEAGAVGLKRSKAFLASVFEGASADQAFMHSCEQAESIAVDVEVPVPDGGTRRRIDLLFTWSMPGGEKFAVAVEAKFAHSVLVGTLPAYKGFVRRLVRRPDNARLVLLTLPGAPHPRNKDWQPVAWRTLLSRWEKRLADDQDDDPHFARFRRLIWNTCRGERQ